MTVMPSSGLHAAARAGTHPVTVTIDAEHPGPVVPDDFAGLSFERGPLLSPGNAGVSGNLFSPANNSLITLFRNLGLGSLRIGGGTVDQLIPAGTGGDGLAGIDDLFAFAAAAGVKVIYSLRPPQPRAASPIGDLKGSTPRLPRTGRYQQNGQLRHRERAGLACHHSHPPAADPRSMKRCRCAGQCVPRPTWPTGGACRRGRAWRRGAVVGPDLGAYTKKTYTPDPTAGCRTEQLPAMNGTLGKQRSPSTTTGFTWADDRPAGDQQHAVPRMTDGTGDGISPPALPTLLSLAV